MRENREELGVRSEELERQSGGWRVESGVENSEE
jgi:hypothetical protein